MDEKKFVIPRLKKGDLHPESDEESEELRKEFSQIVTDKNHPDSIMAMAVVTKPVLRPGWTDDSDMWLTNGKIGIYRCTKIVTETNGKKKYETGPDGAKRVVTRNVRNPVTGRMRKEPVYEVPPNTPREDDSTMDGAMYSRLMREKALPDVVAYMSAGDAAGSGYAAAGGRTIGQEDGAPGHGFANKAKNEVDGRPGRATGDHKEMEEVARALEIEMEKQSAKTPEGNLLDLGVWYHLWSRVMRRYKEFIPRFRTKKELLDKLWAVVEAEFWAMDPHTLYVIAEHKIDICKHIVEAGGDQLKKERHGGARKRAAADIKAAKRQRRS
eukprot:SAG11_NODE_13_length_26388_cov_67.360341_20_plen_326_part_00